MIISWQCQFCGWMNDNNNGPCRKCAGHVEERLERGKWRDITIQKPKPKEEWGSVRRAL